MSKELLRRECGAAAAGSAPSPLSPLLSSTAPLLKRLLAAAGTESSSLSEAPRSVPASEAVCELDRPRRT
eukprot:scaffold803_cov310-Pinguiococcus_pyrenoidosus.AAC.71